jgi:hypothetical protein
VLLELPKKTEQLCGSTKKMGIEAPEKNRTNLLDEERKWVLKLWKTPNNFFGSIKKMGS